MRWRKKNVAEDVVAHRYARTFNGFTLHVHASTDQTWTALCGATLLDDRSPVTYEEWEENVKYEHDGLRYCRACGEALRDAP